ncbi:MAG: FkbM family methyltransferase [Pedosphaera sp.]|nr:FkbM family methyltransferase [Pedosphaera sp.]
MSRLKKLAGFKAPYLSLAKKSGWMPIAVNLPIFGNVSTVAEVKNIHDNFAAGEMRDPIIEEAIRVGPSPVVVDCGVNVGITVRWWFQFNPRCRVVGVDMVQEAHDFTVAKLSGIQPGLKEAYEAECGVLSSEEGRDVAFAFDDPLHGENAATNATGQHKRSIRSLTLDGIVTRRNLGAITLLKLDIEGAGGDALLGAADCLRRTKHVIFESHNESEMKLASQLLGRSGFLLRRFRNRNSFWEKAD